MSSTFQRARRLVAGKRRGARDRPLLELDEAERRLRPFNRRYVGMRAIPVDAVVGTDGRGRDFDRDFLPRRAGIRPRLRSVADAFPEGDFPPIVAYKLGDAYFVIDGHHRVAIARRRRVEMIDAEVTELTARWQLSPDADLVELIHAEQQRFFLEESGLARSRPSARIAFSRPNGYIELLENVQIHGYHRMLQAGKALDPAEIAADWYDAVYLPAVGAARADGLLERYADSTEADLFLLLYKRRRDLFPDCGCPPLQQVADDLQAERPRRFGRRRLAS